MALNLNTFTLVHRHASGKTDSPYSLNEPVAYPVIASVEVCRSLLRTDNVRGALVTIAKEVSQNSVVASERYVLQAGLEALETAVNEFIQTTLHCFPQVYVDDSFTNLGCVAAPAAYIFDIGSRPPIDVLFLNGLRVRHMVAARRMNMGLTDPRNQEFRVFIYITASALLRGLANLFVDFLTKDPQMTQPFVQAEIPPPGAHIREAGRVLETRLFEGTIVLCHDPARGDEQPGIPYIVNSDGIYRIPQQFMDDLVYFSQLSSPNAKVTTESGLLQDFNFPYPLETPLIDAGSMKVLGGGDVIPIDPHPLDGMSADELRGGSVYAGAELALLQLPVREE